MARAGCALKSLHRDSAASLESERAESAESASFRILVPAESVAQDRRGTWERHYHSRRTTNVRKMRSSIQDRMKIQRTVLKIRYISGYLEVLYELFSNQEKFKVM